MHGFLTQLAVASLKPHSRLDLARTRKDHIALGRVLFFGLGLVSALALLSVGDFSYKWLVYSYIAYCFAVTAAYHWYPEKVSLLAAVLQLPAALVMIVSVQWLLPLDLVYLSAFVFPVVFVVLFEFHRALYTRGALLLALLATGGILSWRDMPHWPAYLITTFGTTLIVGQVVDQAFEKVRKLANYDDLTGLLNRRHWEERLSHLMQLSERERASIAVAYLDIDNFKQVNDRQGHAEGDALLRQLAYRLQAVCRESDLVARWGGDEFVIAMPHANQAQAQKLIDRLQHELGAVQLSAGVVAVKSGETVSEVLRRADQAMYQIKSMRQRAAS